MADTGTSSELGTVPSNRGQIPLGIDALVPVSAAILVVVGFNLRRFDYRVLAGYTGADYNRLVPTLDLLEEIHRALGFRLRLDHLARETLGSGKSADGLACLEWVREGRLDLVTTRLRIEMPRSPRAALATKRPYCLRMGSSRCSCARICATWSGLVTNSASIIFTGSPGTRKSMLKTASVTPKSTGTTARIRRRIHVSMARAGGRGYLRSVASPSMG